MGVACAPETSTEIDLPPMVVVREAPSTDETVSAAPDPMAHPLDRGKTANRRRIAPKATAVRRRCRSATRISQAGRLVEWGEPLWGEATIATLFVKLPIPFF